MARGDIRVFDAVPGYLRDKDVDIAAGSWAIAFLSSGFDVLLATETNPALGSTNCQEVSAGGSYSAGGTDLTLDNSDSGGVLTMKLDVMIHPGGIVSWAADAANPTNVKSALLYDKNATTPTDAAVAAWDLTLDGGATAISLADNQLDVTFGVDSVLGNLLKVQVA